MTHSIDWKQWLKLEPLPLLTSPTEEGARERLRYLKSLIIAILLCFVGIIFVGAFSAFTGLTLSVEDMGRLSVSSILLSTGLSVVWLFGLPALGTPVGREALRTLGQRPKAPLAQAKPFWGFIGVGVVIILTLSSVLNYLSEWLFVLTGLDSIFSIVDPVEEEINRLLEGAGYSLYPIIIFSICICPAVAEELFFRGVIDRALEYQLPSRPWLTMLISGAVFSLLHLSAVGFLSRLVMGMLFAYSYRKTNRLYVPMLLHFLNNLIATILFLS